MAKRVRTNPGKRVHRVNAVRNAEIEEINVVRIKERGEYVHARVVNLVAHLMSVVPEFDKVLSEAKALARPASVEFMSLWNVSTKRR